MISLESSKWWLAVSSILWLVAYSLPFLVSTNFLFLRAAVTFLVIASLNLFAAWLNYIVVYVLSEK